MSYLEHMILHLSAWHLGKDAGWKRERKITFGLEYFISELFLNPDEKLKNLPLSL